MASTAGNIWTSISSSSPARRPRNRSRLKANAAEAPMIRAPAEVIVVMISELVIHFMKGHWSLLSSAVKLSKENVVGKMHNAALKPDFSGAHVPLSELSPEKARLTTYTAGNNAQM